LSGQYFGLPQPAEGKATEVNEENEKGPQRRHTIPFAAQKQDKKIKKLQHILFPNANQGA
jgi:hypothetical protein